MRLSEYLIEAVARRKEGKYLKNSLNGLEYDELTKWLDDNGFSCLGYIDYIDFDHLRDMLDTDNTFYYKGNKKEYISIHSKAFYKLYIDYTGSGSVKKVKLANDHANIYVKELSEDQAIKLIESCIK